MNTHTHTHPRLQAPTAKVCLDLTDLKVRTTRKSLQPPSLAPTGDVCRRGEGEAGTERVVPAAPSQPPAASGFAEPKAVSVLAAVSRDSSSGLSCPGEHWGVLLLGWLGCPRDPWARTACFLSLLRFHDVSRSLELLLKQNGMHFLNLRHTLWGQERWQWHGTAHRQPLCRRRSPSSGRKGRRWKGLV